MLELNSQFFEIAREAYLALLGGFACVKGWDIAQDAVFFDCQIDDEIRLHYIPAAFVEVIEQNGEFVKGKAEDLLGYE